MRLTNTPLKIQQLASLKNFFFIERRSEGKEARQYQRLFCVCFIGLRNDERRNEWRFLYKNHKLTCINKNTFCKPYVEGDFQLLLSFVI